MDNASKALLMAGGVMIAIAVIGVAVFFYSNARGFARQSSDMLSASEIQSSNRFYTSYRGAYEDQKIYLYDAINILNRAVQDDVERLKFPANVVLKGNRYEVTESAHYMDKVNYEIGYDSVGRVNRISVY